MHCKVRPPKSDRDSNVLLQYLFYANVSIKKFKTKTILSVSLKRYCL